MVQFTDPSRRRHQVYLRAARYADRPSTDPKGNTTQYQYDQNGDLTSTIFADGTVETNAYNPIGELDQSTDRRPERRELRLQRRRPAHLTETYSNGTQTSFAYDPYGDLVSATNAAGTTTLTYDKAANRLFEILYPDGTFLKYTYNAAGHRLTRTDQTGYTVNYAYNVLGQLTGLSDSSGLIVSYTYDSEGRLSEEVKGNATYTLYTPTTCGRRYLLVPRQLCSRWQHQFQLRVHL